MSQPRIVLFHATPVAMQPILSSMARLWPEAEAINLLDDGLSADRAKEGDELSVGLSERFINFGKYGHDMGADGILVTCSAFGPAIESLAEILPIPVLKPNEAMFKAAIASGEKKLLCWRLLRRLCQPWKLNLNNLLRRWAVMPRLRLILCLRRLML